MKLESDIMSSLLSFLLRGGERQSQVEIKAMTDPVNSLPHISCADRIQFI